MKNIHKITGAGVSHAFIRSSLALMMLALLLHHTAVRAATGDQLAWGENAGFFNFNDSNRQVFIYPDHLEGYIWNQSVGWIKLGSRGRAGSHTYSNQTLDDWGVNRSSDGALSGFAWSENSGWVNFDSGFSQVRHDTASGLLSGYAWSESLGWVSFTTSGSGAPYGVDKPTSLPTEGVQLPPFACFPAEPHPNNSIINSNPSLKYIAATLNQPRSPVIDLNSDIVPDTDGLLYFLKNSPDVIAQWFNIQELEQDPQTGVLNVLNSKNERSSLRPVAAFQNEGQLENLVELTGVITGLESGHTLVETINGRMILFESGLLAEDKLTRLIDGEALALAYDNTGQMLVTSTSLPCTSASDSHFFSMFPAVVSEFLNQPPASPDGQIVSFPFPDVAGSIGYAHQTPFQTGDSTQFEQIMYPSPADWDPLFSTLLQLDQVDHVALNSDGIISVFVDRFEFRSRMDYKVNPAIGPSPQELLFEQADDLTGNGFKDYKVTYPNGQWQYLYLLERRG